jgi:hypothetical protein
MMESEGGRKRITEAPIEDVEFVIANAGLHEIYSDEFLIERSVTVYLSLSPL